MEWKWNEGVKNEDELFCKIKTEVSAVRTCLGLCGEGDNNGFGNKDAYEAEDENREDPTIAAVHCVQSKHQNDWVWLKGISVNVADAVFKKRQTFGQAVDKDTGGGLPPEPCKA